MQKYLKPSEVFAAEVLPAYAEYLSEPLSERRAKIAATALDHHLDWAFFYYERVDKSRLMGHTAHSEFRNALFTQCPPMRIMWEISDAAHHRFLDVRRVERLVTTATNAFTEIADELWVAPYEVPFLPELEAAVDFWRQWPD